jgi:hypothetical protein
MIKLVVDPSAVLAYTQRKHNVAELLGEADEVILAGLALAEMRSELVYSEELYLFDLLIYRLPTLTVTPLLAEDAVGVGRLAAMLENRLGLAASVLEAHRREALLVTAHAKLVRKAIGELSGVLDL